ncbi:MAG: hypothetical protein AB1432_11660, partial [Bacteroidota bacterium]
MELINPYIVKPKIETDPLTNIEYDYNYVYDQSGTFIERFFYGDSSKPGFGASGYIYIDMPYHKANAYNLNQLENTVLQSNHKESIERFNQAIKVMNDTNLPYHLALTLVPEWKPEVDYEQPLINVVEPTEDLPLLIPEIEYEQPLINVVEPTEDLPLLI